MNYRRIARAAFAMLVGFAVVPFVGASAVTPSAVTGTTAKSGAFTASQTVSRSNLVNGQSVTVDSRKVTLNVSQTQDLRGRQEIAVSWTGAHPTGGIIADQNSIAAEQEEYPFVLLECRDATTKGAATNWVTPQTCWTQSWDERYQDSFQSEFPPYRLDRYATAADRAQVADAPATLPAGCYPAPTQHWVPFTAADGTVYENGPAGCAGQPPESQSVGGSALPSNETFGVTLADGTGSASFDVWTEAENASLGCSQSVACSLVAVPIEGISCDPSFSALPASQRPVFSQFGGVTSTDVSDCESTGNFAPGQLVSTPQDAEALSVSGALWWSASNWRNRIVVPLTFGPPANACSVVTDSHTVDIYGSELMIPATTQWAPHFCLNSQLFKLTHVQTGEPEARNLVATGSAEAAFTSEPQPGGYGRAVVSAPVAMTGFAVSYVIDGADGRQFTSLKLDARLLAKLLTESYPADLIIKQSDSALANNPLNITLDPEFQALNPGITQGVSASEAASTLLAVASDSDVIQALTTYINDDPDARAWLNGQPDPWGMVVNPVYKGIQLPVDQWPLLDTFEPTQYYQSDLNDCLYNNPVPFLPLVADPAETLEDVSEDMQFAIAQPETTCQQTAGTSLGEKLVVAGRQTTGYRFMIGITSLGDAQRYDLNTAALATGPNTYVAPTPTSLHAAAVMLKPDPNTGTWPIPYQSIETSGSSAYPGAMVVYAAIPTEGLPATDAQDYATFLDFASTAGQTPGYGVGQLPPGYLPMTKANGLIELAAYTQAAAKAVAAQKGALPSLTGNVYSANPQPTSTTPSAAPKATKTTGSAAPSSAAPVAPLPPAVVSPVTTPKPSPTPTPTLTVTAPPVPPAPSVSASPAAQVVDLAETPTTGVGGAGGVVVAVVIAAIAGAVLLPLTYLLGRWRRFW